MSVLFSVYVLVMIGTAMVLKRSVLSTHIREQTTSPPPPPTLPGKESIAATFLSLPPSYNRPLPHHTNYVCHDSCHESLSRFVL